MSSRFLSSAGPWMVGAVTVALGTGLFFATRHERSYTVRGVIRAPYEGGALSIQHEAIPGYMPAMTMPFNVAPADAQGLAPGDKVEFKFRVGQDASRATHFRKVGRADVAADATGVKRDATTQVRRLRAGDRFPEFALTDQEGRAFTNVDLRAGPTIVTFIFTRCPVPEFCPLIAKKFQVLQSELVKINRNARLLSISIDPEHDQPAILRAYGESLGADFSRWRFATGNPDQIATLAKHFAVRAERTGGSLDHTLATALIGSDQNVVEIWRGNGWKPEEILAKLDEARPAG
jgi:protein SCO1/2